MKEYKLGELSSGFWKGLILTIILAILGGSGMLMVAKHKQSTTYTAERSVVISHRIDKDTLRQVNDQDPVIDSDMNMMQTYADIAQDERIAQVARQYLPKKLQKKYSANDISQDVDANSHPQSLVLKIRVKTDNEKDSVALVNATAKGLKKELPSIQPGAGKVILLATANEDNVTSITSPNKKKYMLMGTALGGLLGIVISFVVVTWKKYVEK